MTVKELRAKAAAYDAAGEAALARGEAREAAVAFNQAEICRLAADELERIGAKRLPKTVSNAIVDKVMFTAEHKVALSRAKTSPKSKVAKAAQEAGYSLADAARAIGVHPTLMTLAAQGKRGMPTRAAEAFEKLTGYPASSWPRLS